MRRRDFMVLVAGGTTAWPLHVHAQQPQKVPRIGVLLPGTSASFSLRTKALLDGLRELGHVEGKTVAIEWKWGEDRVETLSELATELVQSNVDVIVTGGTSAAKALRAATSTIPIVAAIVGDPVAAGLVNNLARPGGNLTGFSIFGRKTSGAAEGDRARYFIGGSAFEYSESAIENRIDGDADRRQGNAPAALSG
jgi:putative ABC transport system substrate-binding protein